MSLCEYPGAGVKVAGASQRARNSWLAVTEAQAAAGGHSREKRPLGRYSLNFWLPPLASLLLGCKQCGNLGHAWCSVLRALGGAVDSAVISTSRPLETHLAGAPAVPVSRHVRQAHRASFEQSTLCVGTDCLFRIMELKEVLQI